MFTEQLFEKVKPIWKSYLEHPFVKGIGDGTLDVDKFQFYMQQDYIYLIEYCRVFALGSAKASTLDTMSLFSELLHATLNGEMELHRQYAERLGISREELEHTKPSATMLAYTSYMLNKAYQGSEADVVACVLACAWSYNYIGLHLNEIEGAADHEFYGDWIRTYSSPEFTALAEKCKALINELAEGKSSQERQQLEDIVLYTSKFEYMFWEMAYTKKMWVTEEEHVMNV
ncbi:thiaminase II [Pontibacillus litoralis]|uniref:Aminopyrimidine aminohydrolase n=1 Tax=Pontibacillus litoralis JSM 072002 TaxID=1385512 RepID=A0A0A5HUR3_9BACI|nr:thiaminase II [Pontibacillus litoralis]KGX87377.1 thiaminase [Pontibacillus litoralis JSM 072002]